MYSKDLGHFLMITTPKMGFMIVEEKYYIVGSNLFQYEIISKIKKQRNVEKYVTQLWSMQIYTTMKRRQSKKKPCIFDTSLSLLRLASVGGICW